jgi:dihydropteroate synthase
MSQYHLPKIMAILNITNDSFYKDSRTMLLDEALTKAEQHRQNGAEWLDIGAESTRPNATPISYEQELERLAPILAAIKKNIDIKISVDTRHSETMQYAIDNGALMINDTHALSAPNALETIAKSNVLVTLMHMQNSPSNMQDNPTYENVVNEVLDFLRAKIYLCKKNNIPTDRIIIDPGFGFGKTLENNWELLRNLDKIKSLKVPILIGISRKSFIGQTLGIDSPSKRGVASAIIHSFACFKGVDIIRTHDVIWTKQAITLAKQFNMG